MSPAWERETLRFDVGTYARECSVPVPDLGAMADGVFLRRCAGEVTAPLPAARTVWFPRGQLDLFTCAVAAAWARNGLMKP